MRSSAGRVRRRNQEPERLNRVDVAALAAAGHRVVHVEAAGSGVCRISTHAPADVSAGNIIGASANDVPHGVCRWTHATRRGVVAGAAIARENDAALRVRQARKARGAVRVVGAFTARTHCADARVAAARLRRATR